MCLFPDGGYFSLFLKDDFPTSIRSNIWKLNSKDRCLDMTINDFNKASLNLINLNRFGFRLLNVHLTGKGITCHLHSRGCNTLSTTIFMGKTGMAITRNRCYPYCKDTTPCGYISETHTGSDEVQCHYTCACPYTRCSSLAVMIGVSTFGSDAISLCDIKYS